MKRRLFAILAALSLTLMLAAVFLWMRSYWYHDRCIVNAPNGSTLSIDAQVTEGCIEFMWLNDDGSHVDESLPRTFMGFEWLPNTQVEPWVLSAEDNFNSPDIIIFPSFASHPLLTWGMAVIVPLWFPLALCSLLPLAWVIAAVFRRKTLPGLCESCGYDLRASKDRCPECGAAKPLKPAKPLVREKKPWLAILAAASLLLMLTTVGGWIRSYWFYDRWQAESLRGSMLVVRLFRGQVMVKYASGAVGSPDEPGQEWDFAGFEFNAASHMNDMTGTVHRRISPEEDEYDDEEFFLTSHLSGYGPRLTIPAWFPVALFAILPACWLATRLRRKHKQRLCTRCGCDLRASKDACPECGTAISAPPAKAAAG